FSHAKLSATIVGPNTGAGCNCGPLFLPRDDRDIREDRWNGLSAAAWAPTAAPTWRGHSHTLSVDAAKHCARPRGSAGTRRPIDHVSSTREQKASLKWRMTNESDPDGRK